MHAGSPIVPYGYCCLAYPPAGVGVSFTGRSFPPAKRTSPLEPLSSAGGSETRRPGRKVTCLKRSGQLGAMRSIAHTTNTRLNER